MTSSVHRVPDSLYAVSNFFLMENVLIQCGEDCRIFWQEFSSGEGGNRASLLCSGETHVECYILGWSLQHRKDVNLLE